MRFADFQKRHPVPEKNVFVFVCADEFLIQESRAVLASAFPGKWVVEKMSAKEFDEIPVARLMDAALTPSLFSESRIIMVATADKLTKPRFEDLKALQEGVEKTSLKIALLTPPPKGKTRSLPEALQAFPAVSIDDMNETEATRWLIDRYKLSPAVARYLIDNAGIDLCGLDSEVQKLEAYTAGARPITERDVDVMVLNAERFGVWALDDALIAADYPKAVHVVGAMLEEGTKPQEIVPRIARVWRQLFIVNRLAPKQGPAAAAAAAGVPGFRAGEFASAAGKYGSRQLARGFRDLFEADRAFKTVSPDEETYFCMLLWKLIGGRDKRRK